jgi:translocation and assembly module TamB
MKVKRILWRAAAVFALLLVLAAVAGVLVLRSDRFREYVRGRIVEVAQRATGGQVELGTFSFDWTRLEARVEDFVLRGREPQGDPPLVRIGAATLGLSIVSVFERSVTLRSLTVERPEVRIIFFPDGSTNFPGPPGAPGRLWSERMLDLKIGRYEIANGTLEFDQRRTPLDIQGENLRISMDYDPAGPSYRGQLSSDQRFRVLQYGPVEAAVSADFALEGNRVALPRLDIALGQTTARLSGALEDFRGLHGTLALRLDAAVADGVRIFRLNLDPAGRASMAGTLDVSFAGGFRWEANGRLALRGLRYRRDRLNIENAAVRGTARITPEGFTLRRLQTEILGAPVAGDLTLSRWRTLHLEGEIAGLGVRTAAAVLTERPVPWDGTLTGPFSLDATLGQGDLVARATLAIRPVPDAPPIEGHAELVFDQAAQTVALGSSAVATRASRVEVEGTLGKTLRLRLRTTDLNDLLPAVAMVAENAPAELPVKLINGSAALDGAVTGALNDPQFRGQAAVINAQVGGYTVDQFSGEVAASRREVLVRNLSARRGAAAVTGTAALTARPPSAYGGFADAEIAAQLDVSNLVLADLAKEAGLAQPVSGTAGAVLRVSGSVTRPEAGIELDVRNPSAFGETMDRLRASLSYRDHALTISNGSVDDGGARIAFSGSYRHAASDWKTGEVEFDAVTEGIAATRFERIAQVRPAVESTLNGRLHGTGRISAGAFTLSAANVDLSARSITIAGDPIGDFTITAETRGLDLTMNAGGFVREGLVEASGAWRLEGDAPGSATVRFSRLSIDSVFSLLMTGRPQAERNPPPFEGFVEGGATISLPLQRPNLFRAEVQLAAVQVNPRPNQVLRLGVQPQDAILRNNGPVILEVTASEARVRSARFTGRDTSMALTGVVPLQRGAGADLAVNGNVNLVILQLLNPDLLAQGNASVQATIRGNLQDPNVNGRLELRGASLYLANVPNGVDNVQGSILFDRRRATIEKLSAETGGGTFSFTGFLEFGPALVYRIQARASQVRVRYPQDVSNTFDANLALNGTAEASTLSGTVTLTRSAVTLSADLGQMLARLAQPAPAAESPNEYLEGMRFDVRVASSPAYQFETSLSRDVEAEVDLRVRGSPLRPIVLGTVSVNRGEIQIFGNRYSVDRGDIRFLNPVKIEPTFDMDLSTRARGVTVNISFSGTLQRLNVNYSSDPPLQTSEIIALLAVGRDPALAASQSAPGLSAASSSGFAAMGGSLLGQAASAQISSRLQRFFGASRVKIDPTLTGVDNIPQARLTFEQQVSRDITLTYITNLNRTNEQVVRLQWDLSREWSAIAVRDQNGLFGVDFQFRKRFR